MKKIKKPKFFGALLMALAVIAIVPTMASAHCDTMDGPTVGDAKKAIESNNPSYILKWVQPDDEKEVTRIFDLTMKVRELSPEAKELADNYLFENLVRIHRAFEGAPFTGVKPHGTPIDEKIAAADKSIEVGNLSPVEKYVPKEKMAELQERFDKVMSLKDYDVNNVEAGREYIEAYVKFFKFAEGEEEGHEAGGEHQVTDEHAAQGDEHATTEASEKSNDKESQKGAESLPVIPWSLAGILFATTLTFAVKYHKEHSKK
ncbi:LysM domain-containing protein [Neobacillus sp. MM2021_6]|uniref:DUF6448 family protein n=1 Tax=Bacillaceae TaxID=186817 RepID=UPI00140E840A|nr:MULTISPECIES: DUF6448 family protein [Bacillaceae]MBO0962830.1 LysM domain-containing protein [Neobacillus sp. MM2021_6]NHC20981.1 LysM domain-containing protein [Bacillus sp. MM2020_4]